MAFSLALGIIGLALFDSTSFGTSLLPPWLLLMPGRVRVGRMTAYLITLGHSYLIAGVLVVLGVLTGGVSTRELPEVSKEQHPHHEFYRVYPRGE